MDRLMFIFQHVKLIDPTNLDITFIYLSIILACEKNRMGFKESQ